MLTFDHLKLIDGDPAEMKRYRAFLVSLAAGWNEEAGIMHEADGSCCRREAWNATMARIVVALSLPRPVLAVNTNRPGEGTPR